MDNSEQTQEIMQQLGKFLQVLSPAHDARTHMHLTSVSSLFLCLHAACVQ
jgi:hypothetical protein